MIVEVFPCYFSNYLYVAIEFSPFALSHWFSTRFFRFQYSNTRSYSFSRCFAFHFHNCFSTLVATFYNLNWYESSSCREPPGCTALALVTLGTFSSPWYGYLESRVSWLSHLRERKHLNQHPRRTPLLLVLGQDRLIFECSPWWERPRSLPKKRRGGRAISSFGQRDEIITRQLATWSPLSLSIAWQIKTFSRSRLHTSFTVEQLRKRNVDVYHHWEAKQYWESIHDPIYIWLPRIGPVFFLQRQRAYFSDPNPRASPRIASPG